MNNFEYSLSLRLTGDHHLIEKAKNLIDLPPCRTKPNREYKPAYLAYTLADGKDEDISLGEEIATATEKITGWMDALGHEMKSAKIQLVVAIFCDNNCGFMIYHGHLCKLAEAGCGLIVEIYPPDGISKGSVSAVRLHELT